MSSAVHLYRAPKQSAVRYRVHLTVKGKDTSIWIDNSLFRRIQCFNCSGIHQARNMVVQVYYDGTYAFCKEGFGCKLPTKRKRRKRRATDGNRS